MVAIAHSVFAIACGMKSSAVGGEHCLHRDRLQHRALRLHAHGRKRPQSVCDGLGVEGVDDVDGAARESFEEDDVSFMAHARERPQRICDLLRVELVGGGDGFAAESCHECSVGFVADGCERPQRVGNGLRPELLVLLPGLLLEQLARV